MTGLESRHGEVEKDDLLNLEPERPTADRVEGDKPLRFLCGCDSSKHPHPIPFPSLAGVGGGDHPPQLFARPERPGMLPRSPVGFLQEAPY